MNACLKETSLLVLRKIYNEIVKSELVSWATVTAGTLGLMSHKITIRSFVTDIHQLNNIIMTQDVQIRKNTFSLASLWGSIQKLSFYR